MLVRTDPFRDFDRLAQQIWGTTARPAAMPMDAWRDGEQIVVEFDLPGGRRSSTSDSRSDASGVTATRLRSSASSTTPGSWVSPVPGEPWSSTA
jgi:hypothetical protein